MHENEDKQQDDAQTTGTATEGQQPEADKSGASQQTAPASVGRTFTQTEVSSMMAKEKNQGRNAVYNELGIDPTDTRTIALVKALAAAQAADGGPKTTEQVQAAQNFESRLLEAEQRAVLAEMKTEALAQGVGAQYVDDVVTLATARLDADENVDLRTVLGEIRAKYPTFFNTSSGDSKDDIGSRGTGSSVSHDQKHEDDKSGAGLGARLAAQRRNNASKSAFFVN